MSGGDVRVLRQEAGPESPRMPAWKREILERRKAKGSGGSGGAGAGAEAGPPGSSPRVNGSEVTGSDSGLKTDNGTSAAAAGSGRCYTITTGSQHFVSKRGPLASPDLSPLKTNKDPWASAGDLHDTADPAEKEGGGAESLVLHDSLGPLQENPFIKLEKERKRRQDRENAARPVQHILELYGSVPGIRTIRAENIIIIESDPDYFPESGSKSQQNGVSSYSSLNDLLDRRGSAVTEIRAREVVIYDTTLSKSEENLSTLGRSEYDYSAYDAEEGPGRVSRMLQKFDSNYGKLQKKSQSTDDLLGLDSMPGGQHRPRPKPQPDLVPKPYAVRPQPGSPVRSLGQTRAPTAFQVSTHPSPRPKLQPAAAASTQDVPAAPAPSEPPQAPPPSVSSYRQRFEDAGPDVSPRDEPSGALPAPRPAKEREPAGDSSPKTKLPRSPDPRRAGTALSPTAASPRPARTSRFEIRPAPRPDLSAIADGDATARALANLRLQSRNSFTVIPGRPHPAPPASTQRPQPRGAAETPVPTGHSPAPATPPTRPTEQEEEEKREEVRPKPTCTSTATSPSPPRSVPPSPSPPPAGSPPPAPPSPAPSVAPLPPAAPSDLGPVAADDLPVTNIDDVDMDRPSARTPMMQKTKGNTFRVVPSRHREAQTPAATTTTDANTTTTDSPGVAPEPAPSPGVQAPPGPAAAPGAPAPYSHLGTLLKKRYPAADEIQVIGGYLSLGRSCLAKTGSTGKKISFKESDLHSTYEYPSESSAWDSDGEDEEEGLTGPEVADDQPSMVGRIHIPRPSFTGAAGLATNSNDLSSYIPKHSVDFNTWQEHKMDEPAHLREARAPQTHNSEDVMLTPADSSSLSDYSSEPALYF